MTTLTQFTLEYSLVEDNSLPVAAVIVAAGNSTRMGRDKQFLSLEGIPVVARSMMAFQNCPAIRDIVVVTRQENMADIASLADTYGITKYKGTTMGGRLRQQSVQNGLTLLDADIAFVAIHDGARPLVTDEIIQKTLMAAKKVGGAAPAVAVTDTIKRVNEDGRVEETVKRESLRAVQTPQIFDLSLYKKALSQLPESAMVTDDCSIMEQAGYPVMLVDGEASNIKITTPSDLVKAQAFLREAEA